MPTGLPVFSLSPFHKAEDDLELLTGIHYHSLCAAGDQTQPSYILSPPLPSVERKKSPSDQVLIRRNGFTAAILKSVDNATIGRTRS